MRYSLFQIKLIKNFLAVQNAHGTLGATLKESIARRGLSPASRLFIGDLLKRKAEEFGNKPYLYYEDRIFTYQDMHINANRVAHALMGIGLGTKQGIGIMTPNSPAYYDLFFASQRLGMYAVPINTNLRGKGLAHILNNSGVKAIVIAPSLLDQFEQVAGQVELDSVIINDLEETFSQRPKAGYIRLSELFHRTLPLTTPAARPAAGDVSVLMYTSGTTGLPKGVVNRHGDRSLSLMEVLAKTVATPDEILYTCLPLYHANALFVTSLNALCAGASVALDKRFSASRFWDRVRFYNATTFNLLGAMIPILLKQPPQPDDKNHCVRRIITSACPADLWETFEQRFGVEIWEAYGAVDGGGIIIMNIGNAPKGSIGKPISGKIRVVDENNNPVKHGQKGELQLKSQKGKSEQSGGVEYFRNTQASAKKIQDGWIRTGDYVYTDENGFLFFAGRDSETVRRRGENVSTYEVEMEILSHEGILEAAVYGVPSELGEDDIMASLVPVAGQRPNVSDIMDHIKGKLPYYAVPRYWRFVEELPKTGTHRVIKTKLQESGVTADSFDAEQHGLMPKRKG